MFFINEAYYGKNKNIISMEEKIQDIKDIIINGKNPNGSSVVKDLEKLVADEFNYKAISIGITGDTSNINANVLNLINYRQMLKNRIPYMESLEVIKTRSGVKFKNKVVEPSIELTSRAFIECSAEEIMALLLHEIGHCFFYTETLATTVRMSYFLFVILSAYKRINDKINKIKNSDNHLDVSDGGMSLAMNSKEIAELFSLINELITSIVSLISPKLAGKYRKLSASGSYKILSYFSKFSNLLTKVLAPIMSISSVIALSNPLVLLSGLSTNIRNLILNNIFKQYDAEKYSDSFAVSYGYGEGLASLFSGALTQHQESSMKSEASAMLYQMSAIGSSVLMIADPHPDNYKRVNLTLDKLKHELKNKDLSPELKKDIQLQIKTVNSLLKRSDGIVGVNKKINDLLGEFRDEKLSHQSDTEIFDL